MTDPDILTAQTMAEIRDIWDWDEPPNWWSVSAIVARARTWQVAEEKRVAAIDVNGLRGLTR